MMINTKQEDIRRAYGKKRRVSMKKSNKTILKIFKATQAIIYIIVFILAFLLIREDLSKAAVKFTIWQFLLSFSITILVIIYYLSIKGKQK